jgi:glycosyltransferase involved in cell wall biosynthesis
MTPRGSIVVNAAAVGDRPTGLGSYTLHVIAALDCLGEPLIVYTSRPGLIQAPGSCFRRAPAAGQIERGGLGHVLRLLWIQTGLRVAIRHTRPAALLNLMPEGVLGSAIAQTTVVHDLAPLHFPHAYPRQQLYFRRYVPAVLRSSRAIVASSESTRRDLIHFYGIAAETVRVVPAGYDPRRFSPAPGDARPRGEPFALYVGNVMPHKNLLRLVEAFALVARHRPVRLVIRGWGRRPHVDALRGRIEALGLGAKVDWSPYAPADELTDLYRRARMLLLLSLHEGFGLTALEAMACGTPVVVANASSLPEVVGDAGLLVDPADVARIADAIERLFADDRLARELAERGLDRARHFSWERTAAALRTVVRT